MKRKREATATTEIYCERLGDLASLSASAETESPGTESWAEIERRLDRGWRGSSLRRFWPALVVSAMAVLCLGGWLVARRPLGYRVVDCTLAADGIFSTTASRAGAIAFDDGSRMSVEKDARFRLGMLPFGHGAEISLDEGEAKLSVVHRTNAHWAVLAGPFRIDVTGTRLGVRWSRHRGRFRVTMLEGEVLVAGGAVPPATHLHAGQTLDADLVASSFAIASDTLPPAEAPRTGTAGAVHVVPLEPAKQDLAGRRSAHLTLPAPSPRKRAQAMASDENPPETAPEPRPGEFVSAPPPPEPSGHAPVAPALESKPESLRVVVGETGQLANGFTGTTWVASGEGISFSSPPSWWDERTRLRPEAGLLCTSGTVAGLACVNEGMPTMHCNWDRNWGVVIGWHTRFDQKAWGDDAKRAIAVEFRGRPASYRLNAHLKGDPENRMYCVDNYKSGQVVRPSMFKSECWFDKGETLSDFQGVDLFNLQFPSGLSYVAFRYCIAGITLYP